MPRPAKPVSIDAIIAEAAEQVVQRVSEAIAKHVADRVQEGLAREMRGGGPRRPGRPARRPRTEITRWVADSRARRVPNFVIEATGLDTKKKIVARFGDGAAFEKGKPLPKPKAAA
jgi:hypothetical protein